MSKERGSSLFTTDAVPLDNNILDHAGEGIKARRERRESSTSQESRISSSRVTMNFMNANGVHIGNTYNIVNGPHVAANPQEVRDNRCSTSAYRKTREVKDLIASMDIITQEEVLWLSDHIGKGWRIMGALLNYSEGQIDQFEANYGRNHIRQAIYRLLLDWKNSRPEAATVGKVGKALWRAKECDTVQRWALKRGSSMSSSS